MVVVVVVVVMDSSVAVRLICTESLRRKELRFLIPGRFGKVRLCWYLFSLFFLAQKGSGILASKIELHVCLFIYVYLSTLVYNREQRKKRKKKTTPNAGLEPATL